MELNLKRQLTPFEWLQLPIEVRNLFIKWFQIPRTGGAIVTGNTIQSDGHTIEDLSRVSLASLQAFLHTEDTHWDKLLQDTINKMENYVESTSTISESTESTGAESGTVSKRRGRPKAQKAAERSALPVS